MTDPVRKALREAYPEATITLDERDPVMQDDFAFELARAWYRTHLAEAQARMETINAEDGEEIRPHLEAVEVKADGLLGLFKERVMAIDAVPPTSEGRA